MDAPNGVVTFSGADGKVFWKSHPGPQTIALLSLAFEILYGGARGGAKTAALIAWLTMGNRRLPTSHPCYASYLNHPKFRALVLRRDATDLKEFIREATEFFIPFGLVDKKPKEDPPEFRFATGAVIYTNHLKNEDAFEKYKGWNLHKIGIEELTLIEQQQSYLKVLGSLRSAYDEIVPQVFCTTNPDGNGALWVRKRFVKVYDTKNQLVPWGRIMRDPVTGLTRQFIPAKLKDNPSLGPDYLRVMMMQDEKTRRAWLDGDWDALVGKFFSNFRPNGPFAGEPETARHVIPANPSMLMPWWPRYIGMDWGFKDNAATVWLCENQADDRLHQYRELVVNQVGSEQLGVMVAEATIPDLVGQPDLTIPLYLGFDAFQVRDANTRTTAQLIQKGMEAVVGRGSVLMAGGKADVPDDTDVAEIAPDFDQDARIVIHRAGRERVQVWQHIRSLLRFTPMLDLGEPNPEYARKLLEGPDGFNRYEQYIQAFQKKKEVLPAFQIWDNCPKTIDALTTAVHDDVKPEDILETRHGSSHNDELNALRHAVMMINRHRNRLPYKHFMAERMNRASHYAGDPNLMAQVARKAQKDYDKQAHDGKGFRLPRASERRRVM